MTIIFLWLLSLVITGFLSYGYGKTSTKVSQPQERRTELTNNQTETLKDPLSSTQQVATTQSTTVVGAKNESGETKTNTCAKTGFAQKWEYLTPYTLKANDSLQSIATDQLNDSTRVNELMQLNGVGPFVVGATVYLPPVSIAKSSGKIKQIYGKLVEQNETSWHVSFTNDTSG